MNKRVKYLLFFFCLYIYLHNPHIQLFGRDFGCIKLLYIPALCFVIQNVNTFRGYMRCFRKELNFLLFIYLYIIFRTVLGGDLEFIWQQFIVIMEIFLLPGWMLYLAYKIKVDNEEKIMHSLLLIGAVGTVISTLCIAIPPFNEFIRSFFLTLTPDSYLIEHTYRGYGISEGLTSSYGYIQGTMVVLGALYSQNNKWFLFFLPFTFVTALLNARTGAIISAIGVLLFFLLSRQYKLSLLILGIGVILLMNFYAFLSFLNVGDDTLAFIELFLAQLDAIRTNNASEAAYVEELFDTMFVLPNSTEQWWIGRGFSLFRNTRGLPPSDVGFILQLNYGGLIYVSLLFSFVFFIIKKLFKSGYIFFAFFNLFLFVLLDTKSEYILNSGEFRLMILIYVFLLMDKYRQKKLQRLQSALIKSKI